MCQNSVIELPPSSPSHPATRHRQPAFISGTQKSIELLLSNTLIVERLYESVNRFVPSQLCFVEQRAQFRGFLFTWRYVHFMVLLLFLKNFIFIICCITLVNAGAKKFVGNENKFYDRKIQVKIKWKCPATKHTHKDAERQREASEFGVVIYLLYHHLSNELPVGSSFSNRHTDTMNEWGSNGTSSCYCNNDWRCLVFSDHFEIDTSIYKRIQVSLTKDAHIFKWSTCSSLWVSA